MRLDSAKTMLSTVVSQMRKGMNMQEGMHRITKILSAYSEGRDKGRIVRRIEPPHMEARFMIPGFKEEEHLIVPFSNVLGVFIIMRRL